MQFDIGNRPTKIFCTNTEPLLKCPEPQFRGMPSIGKLERATAFESNRKMRCCYHGILSKRVHVNNRREFNCRRPLFACTHQQNAAIQLSDTRFAIEQVDQAAIRVVLTDYLATFSRGNPVDLRSLAWLEVSDSVNFDNARLSFCHFAVWPAILTNPHQSTCPFEKGAEIGGRVHRVVLLLKTAYHLVDFVNRFRLGAVRKNRQQCRALVVGFLEQRTQSFDHRTSVPFHMRSLGLVGKHCLIIGRRGYFEVLFVILVDVVFIDSERIVYLF